MATKRIEVKADGPVITLKRRCRVCGCTDTQACPGGCWWVEPDLCSTCANRPQPRRNAIQSAPRKAA